MNTVQLAGADRASESDRDSDEPLDFSHFDTLREQHQH